MWVYCEVIVPLSECTVKWLYREVIYYGVLYCEVTVSWSDCTLKWLFYEGLYCEVTACPSSRLCSYSATGFNSGFFFHIWRLLCLHSAEYYTRCHALRVNCAAVFVGMVALLGQMNFFGCGCASLWRVGGCPVTALRSPVLSFIQAIDWSLAVVWLSCCWLLKWWARKTEWSGGWAEQHSVDVLYLKPYLQTRSQKLVNMTVRMEQLGCH